MKIGILTMHRVKNYGSALQAYALQQILFMLGKENEIIDYVYPNERHIKIPFLRKIIFLLKCRMYWLIRGKEKHEIDKYDIFIDKYLKISKKQFRSPISLKYCCSKYDIYMTGSDQVWNNRWLNGDNSFFFPFINGKKKIKVSYAASFGSIITSDKNISKWINQIIDYKNISVREKNGETLIKKYIDRDAEVVLDPTLLLSKNEWLKNFGNNNYKENYILVYILSYAWNPMPYANDFIEHYAKTLKLPIKIITAPDEIIERHPEWELLEDVGPIEFINLFANANLVITSSFHGTAFAVNFEVPFYSILENENPKDDRQLSLLKLLDLQNRGVVIGSPFPNLVDINWKNTRKLLETEREKCIKYINNITIIR